ncbi:MAG: glycosyltransferase [Planctomycetota bacterium]
MSTGSNSNPSSNGNGPAGPGTGRDRRRKPRTKKATAKKPAAKKKTPTPATKSTTPAPAIPPSPAPSTTPPAKPPATKAGPPITDRTPEPRVTEPTPPEPPPTPTPADPPDPKPTARQGEPLLFECAWEVCNKLGGIYTVLRSKAPSFVRRWQDRYCLIGPYVHDQAAIEFEPEAPRGLIGDAVRSLREQGFGIEVGRWLITGRPRVVLLHTGDWHRFLPDLRYRLWADHNVPTHESDGLLNDVIAFGEAVRHFLSAVEQHRRGPRKLIAHFHEWMAGVAIPMLRKQDWPGTTVFTTHATLLGRYLAQHNAAFYDHLPFFNPAAEAQHYNIQPQHGLERAAAHGSHVFTTVSDVTGEECKHLLGRAPEVLLPNGLNIARFAAIHEFQNLHQQHKGAINEFVMGHFFPSYTFDLDKTLYFFTSGRYEFRNKGMDVTIEALARLNYRLKLAQTPINVVFFIITKAPIHTFNVGVLQSNAMLEEFKETSERMKAQIGDRIFHAAVEGRTPDLNRLVDEYYTLRLKRAAHAWKRHDLPPIVTHDLQDPDKDPTLGMLRQCQLFNQPDSPVKVVFHPDFINATNPLFGVDYDQFVRGTHLGVFPSYYEPWGYTPLESVALGVPAISSDLSGFGSYVSALLPEHNQKGCYLIHRRQRDFNMAADELADRMFRYCQLSRRQRIELRNKVEAFSTHFDWHNLAKRYHEAHALALDRA